LFFYQVCSRFRWNIVICDAGALLNEIVDSLKSEVLKRVRDFRRDLSRSLKFRSQVQKFLVSQEVEDQHVAGQSRLPSLHRGPVKLTLPEQKQNFRMPILLLTWPVKLY
jgi:hypothetical protein